jgi:rare lipoprotein A (peptidoglycan hydrolase)
LDSHTARRLRTNSVRTRRTTYREPRPDRVAAWAIVLGVLMILLAGATSRADTGGATAPLPPAGEATGGSGQASAGLAAKAALAPVEVATWYGPGFFGHRTACGQILRRSTEGVAHRRLPCGTQVTIYYRGRLATVPVIDRGPYSRRAAWDLTQATARELGIEPTSRVRVLR